jgi:hypothetical protein
LSFPSCRVSDAFLFHFGKGYVAVTGTIALLFDAEQFLQFLFHGKVWFVTSGVYDAAFDDEFLFFIINLPREEVADIVCDS